MLMKEKMTPKERVISAFKGDGFDRIPVINPTSIATSDSMEATGAFFPYVHTDADRMAALAAAGHELTGFDTIAPYFSVQQEAASLGCVVDSECAVPCRVPNRNLAAIVETAKAF
jgi:uroporphyrinogen-III decarboxylase